VRPITLGVVLDLRLYRVTLLPFAVVLIIAAFSLHPRPAVLSSTVPQQTFDGSAAAQTMDGLADSYPDLTPGSAGDDALASVLAHEPSPDGLAGGGFHTSVVSSSVETTAGARTVRTVLATRAGTGAGIALIADRGGSPQGSAGASSGTATLLELAAIYKNLSPAGFHRPLTLVSTAGGASAMAAVAAALPTGTEAAIVIGDVADARGRGPYVVPWSGSGGLAPIELRRTVSSAIAAALGSSAGDVPLADQLARLALPLTTGPQGPLQAAAIPAVLVAAGGESEPTAGAPPVSAVRLGAFGQGLLSATLALGAAPELASAPTRDLAIGTQMLSGWGVRAVVGLLLLSLIGCTLDVLARARRRRAPVGRWIGWVLSFAAPFVLAGLFAAFLGAGGLLPATPAAPVTAAELPVSGSGAAVLVSIGLLFILAWVLRGSALAHSRYQGPPESIGAGAALLIVGSVTATLLWFANPYTAALLIVPLHLWLVVLTREHNRPPLLGALYLLLSLAPLIAAIALLCAGLRVEPLALVWTLVLLIAGGGLSVAGLLLAALLAGCFVAAAALLLRPGTLGPREPAAVTVRGPLSYAGPGSLGGTESALRR
jgi:hypothetical protein